MNARTLVLIGAIALVGIGALMMLGDLFSSDEAPAQLTPAIAMTQIQPYTVITQDMVAQGEIMSERTAKTAGAWQVRDVVGKMSTDLIAPGSMLNTRNVLPIERVRFTVDPNLEIVSLNASIDKMVAGKIKPGALVNLYGFGRENQTNEPFTVLVEPRVWVVAVSAGGSAVSSATLVPNSQTGDVTISGETEDRPATTLTLAVPPQRAYNIIDSFGAQGMNAWVTLAANQTANTTAPATPLPASTATPGLPLDIALTATALFNAIQATVPPAGPATGGGWGAGR
jgi:hypothetical protein